LGKRISTQAQAGEVVDPTICPLCNLPYDDHFVRSEEVIVDGRKVLTPTGWDCPKKPEKKQTEVKDG
jgi:hypothetical protein